MRVFRLSSQGVAQLTRKACITTGLPLGIVMVIAGLVSVRQFTLEIQAIVLGFVAVMLLAPLWFSYRKLRKTFDSYELCISDESLVRRQHSYPDIEIPFRDIGVIRQVQSGISVHSKDKKLSIGIPSGLEGFEEASSLVRAKSRIDFDETPRVVDNPTTLFGAAMLPALGMLAVFVLDNPVIVLPLAAVTVAALGWAIYYSWASPLLSRKLKLQTTLAVFPMLAVAYRAWTLWAAS